MPTIESPKPRNELEEALFKVVGELLEQEDFRKMIDTFPLEDIDGIRLRLFHCLHEVSIAQDCRETVEVQKGMILGYLCEVYRWRMKYGDINAVVH